MTIAPKKLSANQTVTDKSGTSKEFKKVLFSLFV